MKLERKERAALREEVQRVVQAQARLQAAVATANEAVALALQVLNRSVDDYNAILKEAERMVKEVAGRLRDKWDEKSEKWQEGEVGQAALAFVEAWEECANMHAAERASLPDVYLEDIEGSPAAQMLKDLPEESE